MIISLISSKYVSARDVVAADKTKGTFETLATGLVAFPFVDGLSGEEIEMVYNAGRCEGIKDTVTIEAGEKIYFHSGSDFLTNVSAGAVLVGIAFEAASSGATTVKFEFNQNVNA